MVEIRSCKEDDNILIDAHERLERAQENQVEVNVVILQSLSDL